jgi:hypothetical protein
MSKTLHTKIENLVASIDTLKSHVEFSDEDNKEEFLDEIESAIISLQTLEEIVERDAEYAYYKSQAKDEDSND